MKLMWFINQAEALGLSRASLLQSAGLPDSVLHENDLPPGVCIRLLSSLLRKMPDDFAVKAGLNWQGTILGVVGFSLLVSRNIGEFTDRWLHYSNFVGRPMRLDSAITGQHWTLSLTKTHKIPDLVRQGCVDEGFGSMCAAWRFLTGLDFGPLRLEMVTRDRARIKLIENVLEVPVLGGAEVDRAVFSLHHRRHPVCVNRTDAVRWYRQHCIAVLPELQETLWLAYVRDMLLTSYGRPPSLSEAAIELGTSKRTLNRMLAQRGLTYQELVSRYRREYAMELLRAGELCVKDIAYVVGFCDPGSFRRTFRRWTGLSVNRWARDMGWPRPPRQWQPISV